MVQATLDAPLRSFASHNKSFTKLHVEREGRCAALGNNKALLVYHFEQDQDGQNPKRHTVYRYKDEAKRLFAVRFNPHPNRGMHLASAKGQLVHVWNLEEKEISQTSTWGVTTLRQPTAVNVMDLCWHRFNENLLAAGEFLWDIREQNPVQEWKVPGGDSRVLTMQVSFNRKNEYLLASAKVNQVYIWDTRKGRPIDTFSVSLPKDPVTSLDWSSESEYDLLTSGGENFSLWKVDSAKAKEVASRGTASSKRKGTSVLVKKRTWHQPVKKVLFAPFGQAAITVSRGFFEGKQELQTIKMWSIPSSDLQLVDTFTAGISPIVGVSWRRSTDGRYQVASLDDSDHLRLHNVNKLHFARPGVNLPAGDSLGARDYGSTAGSESLETSAATTTPVLRNEILPVVWRLSELESNVPSTTMMETTLDSLFKELVQTEKNANRGDFGAVIGVNLHAAKKYLTFVMIARPNTAHSAPPLGDQDHPDPRVCDADAPHVSRLRVTARVQQGHRPRDAHVVIMLSPVDPATVEEDNPLDEIAVKRMQAAVEYAMRQPPASGRTRTETCLVQLRRDLDECVRNATNQGAAGLSGDELLSRQFGTDDLAEGSVPKKLASPEPHRTQLDDERIPCPRRFGATFAANGLLVVFSSSVGVVRAGRKRVEGDDQQMYTYPRTYGSLIKCLKAGRHLDKGEESQGESVYQPHLPENHGWFRSAWGDGPDDASENEDAPYDLDRSITEEAYVEEDREVLESDAMPDSTWLPISHPDHSLGAGLGPPSEEDGEKREADDGVPDPHIEGELPWTPQFGKTFLVDCSSLLPGSPVFAACYQMGPGRQLEKHGQSFPTTFPNTRGDKAHSERYFGLVVPEARGNSGTGSDTSVSSGGRSRRNSLVPGLGTSSCMPPPPSVPQRGLSATLENAARSSGMMRRTSIDGGQILAPILTRKWESSPDFKGLLGKSGTSTSRTPTGWGTPTGSGRGLIAGSPSFSGSPGRSELARGMRIGSPQLQSQASELEDVAELPLDDSGANVTPPRPTSGFRGDSGTPALKSAHSHLRARQRLGKRRQHQQFPKSPGSSGGPSPPLNTPRLRLGVLTPASPVDTSTSPPTSDVGMDLGQISAPAGHTNGSVSCPWQGTVSQSSSFSTVSVGAFGERAGDRALAAQHRLSGRGPQPSVDSPTGGAAGVGVRFGAEPGSCNPSGTFDEGKIEDATPSVGQLSRHNLRVASLRNCRELASVWALLSEASGRGALGRKEYSGTGKLHDARRLPRWEVSSARLTAKILARYETLADPQTLASIASVVVSGSLDGGCANGLSQGDGGMASHDRYMDCYAEMCFQWGAECERAETVSHLIEAQKLRHATANLITKHGELECVVCNTPTHGRRLRCHRCGHGGHAKHVADWFKLEVECRHEACDCRCLDSMCEDVD